MTKAQGQKPAEGGMQNSVAGGEDGVVPGEQAGQGV